MVMLVYLLGLFILFFSFCEVVVVSGDELCLIVLSVVFL